MEARFIALVLAVCLALPNVASAEEVPPPPASSSASVPALIALPPAPLPRRVHRPIDAPTEEVDVAEVVRRADVATAAGDRLRAVAILHAVPRADRSLPLLHVARLAHVHQLRPGVALGLGAGQLRAVLDVDQRANVAHTVGFVAGGAGAVAAFLGVASLVWGGIFYRPLSDDVWAISVGLWSVGGLLALVAVGFHIEGVVRDGEVRAMLQFVPTSTGASMVISGRY